MSADIPPFSPRPAEYVYAEMAEHLTLRIRMGRRPMEERPVGALPAGARLPGERDLAAEYGVAIGTARSAIEVLREKGLVTTKPAKGTFVLAQEDQPADG